MQTLKDSVQGYTPLKMGLGVKKELNAGDSVGFGALEIGIGEVLKIHSGAQYLHAGVIQIQKFL